MIELKFDLYELKKNPHETIINIKLVEALRAAGIPVVGKLIPSAVEYGTLVWAIEEDLDGDTLICQWFDRDQYKVIPAKKPTQVQRLDQLRPITLKPMIIEDDEL